MDDRTRRVLFLLAVPVAIAVMVGTIWLLHHNYLSIGHNGLLSSRLSKRTEARLVMGGLIAPFVAVLFAIVVLLVPRDPD